MTVVIFIIILAVLILVHEFGHFIIAKKSDIRVDEFGLGFPPKAFGWKPEDSETEYTLNWLPFGGFVKIFGEDYSEEAQEGPNSKRSFINKPKSIQAAVLFGGVLFNVLFAWLLFSIGFMTGMPTAAGQAPTDQLKDPRIIITQVVEDSPAQTAGLRVGDVIRSVSFDTSQAADGTLSIDAIQEFIASHENKELSVVYSRGDATSTAAVTPQSGVIEGQAGIGIAMSQVGTLKLPPHKALIKGATFTATLTKEVTVGIGNFLYRAVTGKANFSQVAGPVGIAGLVGDATALGFVHLLTFTAFISLNLAVLNLIPFPALDGGRLVFVLIEKIKGSRVNPQIAHALNTVGFVLLIVLMIVITYHDILKLV